MSKKQDVYYLFIICLYFAAHIYIVGHINYGLGIKSPYSYLLAAAVFFMAFVSVLSLVATRIHSKFLEWSHRAGHSWMGVFAITVICFLANDLINFIFSGGASFRFFSTLAAITAAAVLSIWSGVNIGFFLRVKKIHIGIEDLKVEKLKIAFIADMHIDKYTPFRKISALVNKINSIKPDLLLFGGDLTDTDISRTYELYGLDKMQAKYGMYAVTGNHEYYFGVEAFLELCAKLDIKVLRNENVEIGGIINLAGINDEFGEKLGLDTSDVHKTLEGVNPDLPSVLLSHKPDIFKEALKENKGTKLIQLSGHTHGGQIPPMGIVGSMFFKYYYGKWEKDGSIVYITSGAGWWGPPMRLFNVSEIVEIVLYRKTSNK